MKKFMRTRSAAPPAPPAPAPATHPAEPPANGHPKTNGYANGGGGGGAGSRRDDHSTLSSQHWSGSAASRGGGALWEDAEFPAAPRSIGPRRLHAGVVWRRPHELSARPLFYGSGSGEGEGEGEGEVEGWEVEVGWLGSAALCAAVAALALTPRLLARVAPPQSFGARYTGAFRFRLWVFGAWREVAVDDRLPCRGARPLGSRGRPHRYLLPLLEKAYAKLYGSYAAMRADAGDGAARALQELTGGVVQSFSLARQPRALTLRVLHSAVPRSTLVVARPAPEKQWSWRGGGGGGGGAGACVCVTGLARVRGAGTTLVRARAAGAPRPPPPALAPPPPPPAPPAGPAWRALSAADRDLLAARTDHPDEFWMSFEEFALAYAWLELVHVGPDDWAREPALRARRPWRAVLARRRWRRGCNAGGPPDAAETTGTNPQFHVQIPGAAGAGGKCHVVVSVTQQYAPRGSPLHAVGFALYERGGTRPLDAAHWSRAREVASFFTLPPGQYRLVPHTRRPHTEAAFLLRVLTDQHADIWEVNEDNLILRSIDAEFLDERQPVPPEMRAILVKLLGDDEIEEVDAAQVRRALRRAGEGGGGGGGGAGAELARALVALRDARVAGRMPARDLPPLLGVLRRWRHAYSLEAGGCRAASSYRLRGLLRGAGVSVSNKVLEALVARFAPRAALPQRAFLLALARLYLAHERFRSLDTKLKSNPLSLEEMILMTIYS